MKTLILRIIIYSTFFTIFQSRNSFGNDFINKYPVQNDTVNKIAPIIFKTSFEFGFIGPKAADEYLAASLLVTNGFNLRQNNFLGIGSGVEFLDLQTVPLYIDYKYYFLKNNVSPYLYIDYGYAFPFGKKDDQDEVNGGQLIAIGLGIRGISLRKRQFNFSLGYRYQKLTIKNNSNWGYLKKDIEYNRLFVKLGWYFN